MAYKDYDQAYSIGDEFDQGIDQGYGIGDDFDPSSVDAGFSMDDLPDDEDNPSIGSAMKRTAAAVKGTNTKPTDVKSAGSITDMFEMTPAQQKVKIQGAYQRGLKAEQQQDTFSQGLRYALQSLNSKEDAISEAQSLLPSDSTQNAMRKYLQQEAKYGFSTQSLPAQASRMANQAAGIGNDWSTLGHSYVTEQNDAVNGKRGDFYTSLFSDTLNKADNLSAMRESVKQQRAKLKQQQEQSAQMQRGAVSPEIYAQAEADTISQRQAKSQRAAEESRIGRERADSESRYRLYNSLYGQAVDRADAIENEMLDAIDAEEKAAIERGEARDEDTWPQKQAAISAKYEKQYGQKLKEAQETVKKRRGRYEEYAKQYGEKIGAPREDGKTQKSQPDQEDSRKTYQKFNSMDEAVSKIKAIRPDMTDDQIREYISRNVRQ